MKIRTLGIFLLICLSIIISCKDNPTEIKKNNSQVYHDDSSSNNHSNDNNNSGEVSNVPDILQQNINITENNLSGTLYVDKVSGGFYCRFIINPDIEFESVNYDWFLNGVYIENVYEDACYFSYEKSGVYNISCIAYVKTDLGYITCYKCITEIC